MEISADIFEKKSKKCKYQKRDQIPYKGKGEEIGRGLSAYTYRHPRYEPSIQRSPRDIQKHMMAVIAPPLSPPLTFHLQVPRCC